MQPAREPVAQGHTLDTLVVAIDGPAGSGKSSAARGVAHRLGLRYLDTGAMYRAVTWWMLRHEVDVADPAAVATHAGSARLSVGTDPAAPTIAVDGRDVTAAIRERDVTNAVSAVSAVPAVRAWLVSEQRALVGAGGIVVEGRDIGTTVAPRAPVKIFLTASAQTRAQRRNAELVADEHADRPVSVDVTHEEMRRRDRLDSSRRDSPLARADDAVEVDTTELTLDGVVDTVLECVRARTGLP